MDDIFPYIHVNVKEELCRRERMRKTLEISIKIKLRKNYVEGKEAPPRCRRCKDV